MDQQVEGPNVVSMHLQVLLSSKTIGHFLKKFKQTCVMCKIMDVHQRDIER